MSRIGKLPVSLLPKTEAKLNWDTLEVTGPLGVLTTQVHELIDISIHDDNIVVTPVDKENPLSFALWGTYRSNVYNMVWGVAHGYTKSLEINWVWFKMEVQGAKLLLSIWFSHKVEVVCPKEITMKPDEKEKNVVHFTSIDKQLLWEFVSKIRSMKKPEPYKWKWIKYVWENIRRKAWKTGK